MSRMGQGAEKARIRSQRGCGFGVRNPFGKDGAPAGARTLDPLIKSQLLCQLSYGRVKKYLHE